MGPTARGGMKLTWKTAALAWGIGGLSGPIALALDGPPAVETAPATALARTGAPTALENSTQGLGLWGPFGEPETAAPHAATHAWLWEQSIACRNYDHWGWGKGALGWGKPGLWPGHYGFGLSFHRGYGYGGLGWGVSTGGGGPFYGGPGYPRGGTPYDGGPAFLDRPGALIRPDRVINDGPDFASLANAGMRPRQEGPASMAMAAGVPYYGYESGEGGGSGYLGGFGAFTGASPYPFVHPDFTADAAATGTVFDPFSKEGGPAREGPSGQPVPLPGPAPGPSTMEDGGQPPSSAVPPHQPGRYLGIDEEPFVHASGDRGMIVARVYPGTAAERAGLQAGDLILSINGYLASQRGNLAWIIANAAPDGVLALTVLSARDGERHTITARLPVPALDTSRPPYLPPVGEGPPPASR